MIRGGALSVGLHVLIAVAILLDVEFFSAPEALDSAPVIPVELTTIGPETNQAVAGEKDPEVPPPETATAPDDPTPPPPVEATPPPEAPPAPLPDANTLAQDIPQPEPEPEPEPVREETPPPPAPRPVEKRSADNVLPAREKVVEEAEKLAALEPLPKPEPKPEPKKEPEPKPEAKPEPKPEAKPKPKPEPEPVKTPPQPPKRKEPEKKSLDLNRLAAKIDKLAEKNDQRPRDTDRRNLSDIRVGEGGVSQNRLNRKLSVTEVDLLRSRLRDNWSPNHGAPGIERMQVIIRIHLNPDGTLTTRPQVIDGFDAGQSSEVFKAFSESAIRAVQKSQPFPLPPEKYQNWREIEINFNLREMYG